MQHDEFLRQSTVLETYAEKLKTKTSKYLRLWFRLDGNTISYSLRERLDTRSSAVIDGNFHFLKKDTVALTIAFSFINKKGKRKTWELRFESMPVFQEWQSKLSIAKRPVWDPESSTQCFICQRAFNFFRRQHHCRHCGKVVCGDHSDHRFLLEDLGYHEPVRVCDSCNKQLS